MHRRAFPLFAALVLSIPASLPAQEQPIVVYVVRHAERAEDGTNDPPISDEGRARARLVAGMLGNAGLTHIHTTDFERTRSTVEPTAEGLRIDPEVYDPVDLDGFARQLRSTPGRHLVVGHSNTNRELIEALGGDPGAVIGEMEYDRAYVLVVLPGGHTGSVIFRFGSS